MLTIYLFLFEVLPVDVTAITIMVMLGLISWQYPFFGLENELLDINHLFDGFASNAVMSIVAVMIIGASLDKTGMMTNVANLLPKWAVQLKTDYADYFFYCRHHLQLHAERRSGSVVFTGDQSHRNTHRNPVIAIINADGILCYLPAEPLPW